jgi:hypothetical protein
MSPCAREETSSAKKEQRLEGPRDFVLRSRRLRDGTTLTEPVTPPLAFELPPGIAADHALELDALVKSTTKVTRFSKNTTEESADQEDDMFGFDFFQHQEQYSCDFTMKGWSGSREALAKFALDTNRASDVACALSTDNIYHH